MTASERQQFHASNGTDAAQLATFCKGCGHYGEAGENCNIWLALDLGEPTPALTVSSVLNEGIECADRIALGRWVACHHCSKGFTQTLGGPEECRKCDVSGRLWEYPSGKTAEYPGGPFR